MSSSTTDTQGDLELAVRLHLQDRGITDEATIQRCLQQVQAESAPTPTTAHRLHYRHREGWALSLRHLARYRDSISYHSIHQADYRSRLQAHFPPPTPSQLPASAIRTQRIQTPFGMMELRVQGLPTLTSSTSMAPSTSMPPTSAPLSTGQLLQQLFAGLRQLSLPSHTVLTPQETNQLEVLSHQELIQRRDQELKDHGQTEIPINCTICQEDYEETPELPIRRTPCHHYFHQTCLDHWLKNYQNTCPNCRASCGTGKIVYENVSDEGV